MNAGWLIVICFVSVAIGYIGMNVEFKNTLCNNIHVFVLCICAITATWTGVAAIGLFSVFPDEGNSQIIEMEISERYIFDVSLPLSVKINEGSNAPATVVIDGYLSENERFSTSKPQHKIKIFELKDDGVYSLEKLAVTYRCTLWFIYTDKTRTEYYLYVPKDIIEKEITLQ